MDVVNRPYLPYYSAAFRVIDADVQASLHEASWTRATPDTFASVKGMRRAVRRRPFAWRAVENIMPTAEFALFNAGELAGLE